MRDNCKITSWAESEQGWIDIDGTPITLVPWQRAVLAEYWKRRADVTTLFVSTVKKAGKTLLDSMILAYRWLTIPNVHFAIGNDRDQSAELQISMIGSMIKRHPFLKHQCRVTRSEILFEPTGSRIVSLPMDASGAAGANFATCSWTELWGFCYEANERLYEELTPVPGDCLRVIDSYAGWEGESNLLRRIWDRGLSGERVNKRWPMYLTGRQLSYIHQGEDAQVRCWRGTDAARRAYYPEQVATMRPGTFRRLHLNEWASQEDAFITPELLDACILANYTCPGPNREIDLFVGLDLAVKHDCAAAVSVFKREGGELWLGPYRIWAPKGGDIDLMSIEEWLIALHRDYGEVRIYADPYQAQMLIQRLKTRRVTIDEFPQTVPNLTKLGNTLFDVIKQGRLVLYPGCTDLRKHVLNAQAKETPRGIRLIKSTAARKIDAAIALGMGVVAATDKPYYSGPTCGTFRYA